MVRTKSLFLCSHIFSNYFTSTYISWKFFFDLCSFFQIVLNWKYYILSTFSGSFMLILHHNYISYDWSAFRNCKISQILYCLYVHRHNIRKSGFHYFLSTECCGKLNFFVEIFYLTLSRFSSNFLTGCW